MISQQDGEEQSITDAVLSTMLRFVPELTALAVGWWMLAQRRYLLVDDAYISFRYAANFAHGHGLVWNEGVPVEGYTCLLWVLLLSLFARLGLDLTWPGVLLSTLFGLACLQLQRNVVRAAGLPRRWELLPCLLLAALPSFAHAMTSAMEETCFAFFVVLALHLLVLSRSVGRLRWWSAAALGTACLIRPEGPLVAAIGLTVEALASGIPFRKRVRDLLPVAAIVGGVVGTHMAARYAYYGYPFPNTFYAKVIFSRLTVERGAAHLSNFLLAGGWLALLGIGEIRRPSALKPWLIHAYALAAAYCTYLLFVGGDHPHWFRFYIPLLPLTFVASAQGLQNLGASFANLYLAKLRGGSRAWLATAVQTASCSAVWLLGVPFSEANEPIVGFIQPEIEKLMYDVDGFFNDVPRDSFCAIAAIGHVGYRHLDLHILDTWGLTDTHIAHMKVSPNAKFGHDKQDLGYVASMKPDYLYLLAPAPTPLPGYDLCWPSDEPPAVVYRRAFALAPAEISLGVPPTRKRRLDPPPACRPPSFLPRPQAQTR
jgi:hypothetical protein